MNKTKLFCSILGMGMVSFGAAQKKTDTLNVETLDEVVLTDSRFALKRENSGKTVIKISRQEIENNQGRTVAQLINTKSGIEINGTRSVAGQNLGYFIRGGNNRQILVMIDGVQVNDPSLVNNEFDLRLLDLNTIESIEIVKGAASTLYGNAAASAVINITTKASSKKRIAASFMSIIGTNQTQDDQNYNGSRFINNVSVNGTLDKFDYLISFSNQFADGLSAAKSDHPERDPFSRHNTNLRLGYKFSDNFSMTSFASFDKFMTDIDGFPPPNFTIADTDDKFISEQKRIVIFPKFEYKKGSIQINAAFTQIDRETISDFGSISEAESLVMDAFNKYVFNKNIYTIVGVNYGNYKSLFAKEESFTNTDPYLNVVYLSNFGLTLNAGGRINNHSKYGSQLVYSLNPSYSVSIDEGYIKVFGSYATSFIAPNLSQLFGFFGPNPDLEPEENRTLEGGLEYNSTKDFRMSVVYFNRHEENTVQFTSFYENAIEDATVQGLEVEADVVISADLAFSANYTFTELKDGERLRLPKHRANASLGYDFTERTFASLNCQFVGNRTDFDFAAFLNEELGAYTLVNLYFSHKVINNKLKLFASADNVFNEDYFEILGYTTQGRNVSVGFNLNF